MSSTMTSMTSTPTKISECTLDTCPVSESYLGYQPSKVANIVFAALFAISFFVYLFQCIRARTWSFLVFMGFGTALECIGYIGRVMLSKNPFNSAGFKIEIICLTFAPAFIAGSIYLILKHLIITFGADFSRIRPKFYTWIFISCDVVSILLQAIGAIIAAIASDNDVSKLSTGNNIMITGLAWQIFTLAVFGLLATEYAFRCVKNAGRLNAETAELRSTGKFRRFLFAVTLAYTVIMIRCIYRLVMMAGGWGNSLMQNQTDFIVLDGVMCVVAVLVLNVWHPGFVFNYSKTVTEKHSTPPPSDVEDLGGAQDRMYANRMSDTGRH